MEPTQLTFECYHKFLEHQAYNTIDVVEGNGRQVRRTDLAIFHDVIYVHINSLLGSMRVTCTQLLY